MDPHSLDIDTSEINNGTLSKAFRLANRTRLKVGRAFSFNKTPSKLKRAVSSMMSPFGSSTNLTPASQLAQMRLASYNNINVSNKLCKLNSVSCNRSNSLLNVAEHRVGKINCPQKSSTDRSLFLFSFSQTASFGYFFWVVFAMDLWWWAIHVQKFYLALCD